MNKHKQVIETVPYVELEKFIGTWYEIGRHLRRSEKGLTHVCVEYTPKDDCLEFVYKADRDAKKIVRVGKIKVMNDCGNAKMTLQFHWPVVKEHWIIEMDNEYQWMVVSNSNLSSLRVMYRKPQISDTLLRSIGYRLVQRGFNMANVEWTEQ